MSCPHIPLIPQHKSELNNSRLRSTNNRLSTRRYLRKDLRLSTHQPNRQDTLATDTVVVSSPEPACEPVQEADLFAADIPTLQNWQRVASENVEVLTTRLARARENLWRITKRLKTMQDGPRTRHSSGFPDHGHRNGNHWLSEPTAS